MGLNFSILAKFKIGLNESNWAEVCFMELIEKWKLTIPNTANCKCGRKPNFITE